MQAVAQAYTDPPVPLQSTYANSHAYFERHLIKFFDSEQAHTMSHSDLERELAQRAKELMRKLLQEHIDSRGPGKTATPVRDQDGEQRTRLRLHKRELESVFGTVNIKRIGYGEEGLASLHLLDADLNLPDELYSLEMRRRVALEAGRNSFDDTVENIKQNTGGHVPKRQSEELAQRATVDFDAFYDQRRWNPASTEKMGDILVLTVDGKGVVMRKQDLREQTRKAAEASASANSPLSNDEQKKNTKRMSTVASVYNVEPFVRKAEDIALKRKNTNAAKTIESQRPKPECKRVWASLKKEPEEVIRDVFQEAFARDPDQRKKWVALVDGNETQIKVLQKIAKEKEVVLTIILDIYHVLVYLWKAARVFHRESKAKQEVWVEDRLLNVLQGKAGHVAAGVRRSITMRNLDANTRKDAEACARYLKNHKDFLRYDKYLASGFPIATGIIEGACRHLVKKRMENSGARWSLAGAEAVLKLRALQYSKDFDEYWTFHENKELERNHQRQYNGGIIPKIVSTRHPSKDSKLKLIKN
jgi:hypothetical protein